MGSGCLQLLVEWVLVAACDSVLIVLLADVLHDLVAGSLEPGCERDRERLGVRAGIFDGPGVDERTHIRSRPPINGVKLLGVLLPLPIEPELIGESNPIVQDLVIYFTPSYL